jgi:sulfonate transport system substrate-binding protein
MEVTHVRRTSLRALGALLTAVTLGTAAAACSSDASTRSGDSTGTATTPAAQVVVPSSVPAGTTLRLGDQLDYLKNVLQLGKQDSNFPYKVSYSAFIGGPPMLQAFQAGALDGGFIQSTPLIFAQAANQNISAVAGWSPQNSAYRLVTAPGVTNIKGWADLKGKKIAYQQGTALEAAALEELDKVGLKQSDVKVINVPATSVSATLQGHGADVGVSVEPLTSVYLGSNPTAKVIGTATDVTVKANFLIATNKALDNSAKSAALADYVARLVRAYSYLRAHPTDLAQLYVKQYHLPLARAQEVLKEAGTTSFISLPGDIVPSQQHLADLFNEIGEVPTKIKVDSEFDTRFNSLVQQVQGSS